jgi:hypothetical protein
MIMVGRNLISAKEAKRRGFDDAASARRREILRKTIAAFDLFPHRPGHDR